jgi:F-type H+-transporting ATPase subunit c
MRKTMVFVLLALTLMVFTTPAMAQDAANAAGRGVNWVAITAGFAMAIASAACGMAQARATAAAAEGLARNPAAAPSIRFALILGLVLIESMALYTLAIIFLKVS